MAPENGSKEMKRLKSEGVWSSCRELLQLLPLGLRRSLTGVRCVWLGVSKLTLGPGEGPYPCGIAGRLA